jgi:hypothetical protein
MLYPYQFLSYLVFYHVLPLTIHWPFLSFVTVLCCHWDFKDVVGHRAGDPIEPWMEWFGARGTVGTDRGRWACFTTIESLKIALLTGYRYCWVLYLWLFRIHPYNIIIVSEWLKIDKDTLSGVIDGELPTNPKWLITLVFFFSDK